VSPIEDRTSSSQRGRLRTLLAAAPGVGKTYAMLAEGQRLAAEGVDVVVGYVETHHREATETKLHGLEAVPNKRFEHRGTSFEEMDTDAVIARRPEVALVDELAHTNVPGGRHTKRWEDVEDLLDAGIDVVTNLNIQHLESLNDAVEVLTGVAQHETVPDAVVAAAESVELMDFDPEELRRRIASGGVLRSGTASTALTGYYTTEHLAALRDLARRWLEDHDLFDASASAVTGDAHGVPVVSERVVVALTGSPEGEHVLRRSAQIASATRGELVGLHVRSPSSQADAEPVWLRAQRQLLAELGGRYAEVAAVDVATAVLEFAANEHARQLVLGATRRSRLQALLHGSVINRAIRNAGPVDVHVIPARRTRATTPPTHPRWERSVQRVPLPLRRRQVAWALAVIAPAAVTLGLAPLHSSIGVGGALFCALVTVVGVAALGGLAPAALATVVGFLLADYFYTVPLHSLRVDRLIDLVALIAYVAVAGVVGVLVDVLARQGLQTSRAQAEAESLARVVAEAVATTPGVLGDLPGTLRRAFDLTGVAVLRFVGSDWQVDASAGSQTPRRPEAATYSVELSDRRVLALLATRPDARETHLLFAFVTELELAGERNRLQHLQRPNA